jgi:hypothetical protein
MKSHPELASLYYDASRKKARSLVLFLSTSLFSIRVSPPMNTVLLGQLPSTFSHRISKLLRSNPISFLCTFAL